MLDRTKAPEIKEPSYFPFPDYHHTKLSNGIDVYCLPIDNVEFTDISFSLKTGQIDQTKNLQSQYTFKMLQEGCASKTSAEIAETFDFYGAITKPESGIRNSMLNASMLTRHLSTLTPLIKEMILHPTFPEKEFEFLTNKGKQDYNRMLEYVSALADIQMDNMLYGENHILGYNLKAEDFDNIKTDDLRAFHAANIKPENIEIYAGGKINDEVIKILDENFGILPRTDKDKAKKEIPPFKSCDEHRRFIQKKGSVQSAIFMAMQTIGQAHPDFQKLSIVNTILGGYYGSRLMSNIREDKGYTYGISSRLNICLNQCKFSIETQAANCHVENLIKETKLEMERMQNEKVGQEELNMVKSYLTGIFLLQMNQGLGMLSTFRNKILNGIECKKFFEDKWNAIHTITAEEIMDLSQKYLNFDDLYISIAGDK